MSNIEIPKYTRNSIFRSTKKIPIKTSSRLYAGTYVEFQYGVKKLDEAGGWKGDPRPILLVFYDDFKKYIEGINTNYLSPNQFQSLFKLTKSVIKENENVDPIYDGERLYQLIKNSNPSLLSGYRRYLRNNILSFWKIDEKQILNRGLIS